MTLNKLRLNANEKGFTLIELMIVIAIIGILAAIAIPNFISYRDKAYCSSAESDANAIASAIADYFAIPSHVSMGTLPAAVATDGSLTDGPSGLTTSALSGTNTATIGGGLSNISITVLDASGRCPDDYINSQDGWSGAGTATRTFNKKME